MFDADVQRKTKREENKVFFSSSSFVSLIGKKEREREKKFDRSDLRKENRRSMLINLKTFCLRVFFLMMLLRCKQ